ncbi:hypothetical protein FI667_g10848, partial [Globisporangium splendens]
MKRRREPQIPAYRTTDHHHHQQVAALHRAPAVHTTEPIVIFTQAVSLSFPAPEWLIVPALLDFLPVMLQLGVHRDVAFQLRRFCDFHGLDTTKCSVLHDALSELVDVKKWCAHGTPRESPSFVIVKSFLVPDVQKKNKHDSGDQHQKHGGASCRWIQDKADNLAIDLCRLMEGRGADVGGTECVESLGGAIQQSFEWLNSLPSCDALEATETMELSITAKEEFEATESVDGQVEDAEDALEAATVPVGTDVVQNTDMRVESNEQIPKNDSETESPANQAQVEIENSLLETTTSMAIDGEVDSDARAGPVDAAFAMEEHAATDKDDATVTLEESASCEPISEAASQSVHGSDRSIIDIIRPEQEADAMNEETSLGNAQEVNGHHFAEHDDEPKTTESDEADARLPAQPSLVGVDGQTSMIDADHHARDTELEPSPFDMSTSVVFLNQPPDVNGRATTDHSIDSLLLQYEALRVWSPASMSRMAGSTEEREPWISLTSEALVVIVSLFFVVCLLCGFRSLAINYIASVKIPQKRGNQISPTEVHEEPECNPEGESKVRDDEATKCQLPSAAPTSVIAPVPSLRSWQNTFCDSSFRSIAPLTYVFVHKVQVLERVAAVYRRQLQRAAFGFWRQKSVPMIQDAASTRSTSQDADSKRTVEEAELKRPPSFTYAAMALLFAMHGAYLHKLSPESSEPDQKDPQLQRTISSLLSNGDFEIGEMTGEDKSRQRAAQAIQRAWRMRRKASVPPSAADKAAPSRLRNFPLLHRRSFSAQPKRPSSLFQLLAKKSRQGDSSRPAILKRATSFGGHLGGRASAAHLSLPPAS